MDKVSSDLEIDQLVWSLIKDSGNPHDHLDFIRHTLNRPFEQELAFLAARRSWSNQEAPRLWGQAVEALERLAEQGNPDAMFHLGRWCRLGYGMEVNSNEGMAWYRQGAGLGSSRCLINLARHTASQDASHALRLFERAAEQLGDLSAHCFWADFDDKSNYEQHLQTGVSSGDGYALFRWGSHKLKTAKSEEDMEIGVEYLRRSADLGESMAATYLGLAFREGINGCPKDAESSLSWFKRSAALGDAFACAEFARAHLVEDQESVIGLDYLWRSVMLGAAYGQSMLGYRYLWKGKSLEEQIEGLQWIQKAAEQGNKLAIRNLADALEHGRGCEVDAGQAMYWLKKGADAGDSDSQIDLGLAYIRGKMVTRDGEKAHNLFHLASLQESALGAYLLGLTYENGDGTEKDLVKAFECFHRAAKAGSGNGKYKLGMAYLWGYGIEEDVPAAVKWLKQAADEGHDDAQAILGKLFVYGHGVQENFQIAVQWLKKAAAQDNAMALRELALLHEEGKGVATSRTEANRLMAKAAALGDDTAKTWIENNCPDKPEWLKEIGQLGEKTSLEDGSIPGDQE
ncbi:MAG: hypothetical protein WBI20_15120 [Burkholderiaceae bacterium]